MTYFLAARMKDIELYCVKCDKISSRTTTSNGQICGLCKTSVIYRCRICKKPYAHRQSIYKHLKYECSNVEPQFKCSQCSYKAKQKFHLQKHVQRKHSIKKCTECGEIFKGSFALRKHQVNECVNEAMLKCNRCSYKSIFKTQLEKHIRREHNSRYTCSQCGKKYIHLSSFNNHKNNLCGSELYFECNHCSYSTNFKSNLKVHIKSQHS